MDSMELAYELLRLLMLYFLGILMGYQIRIMVEKSEGNDRERELLKRLKARRKKNKQNKINNPNIISYSDLDCPPRFDQMSNITPEEHKASREAINDISKDTGVNIYDLYELKDN